MDNRNIPRPTESEKQQAIARILDAGLPRQVAFGRELWEVLQRIGRRALLFDVGDCLALSLASLFLYGALSLLCQRLRGPARWVAAPVCWVLLGLVPLIWPRAAEWLTAIPAAVFCLLATAGITLYLLELRRFCRRPMEGGVSYALR